MPLLHSFVPINFTRKECQRSFVHLVRSFHENVMGSKGLIQTFVREMRNREEVTRRERAPQLVLIVPSLPGPSSDLPLKLLELKCCRRRHTSFLLNLASRSTMERTTSIPSTFRYMMIDEPRAKRLPRVSSLGQVSALGHRRHQHTRYDRHSIRDRLMDL